MQDIQRALNELRAKLDQAWSSADVDKLLSEYQVLDEQMQAADFWQDSQNAQDVSRRSAKLESRLKPWRELRRQLDEASELLSLGDASLETELSQAAEQCQQAYDNLKEQLILSGRYDDSDAIVSIHAGAGGTDAQDWAEMLERMYLRFAEKCGWSVAVVDRSAGEEAGLKSVSLLVSGDFVYGNLKSEHGVHRLVRLSPFNADSLRQTSFAKVEVVPKVDRPEEVELADKDLRIDVYRSGGKGGQSVNTTDSAVRITHLPTGITVAIQNERSQLQNKEMAMTILRSKLAQLKLEQHQEKIEQLKGPNEQAAWGNQIRNYVLHPYKLVKDLRTNLETSDVEAVLGGQLEPFITAYLEQNLGK